MERQKEEERKRKAEEADSDDETEEEEEDHGMDTPPHLLVPPGSARSGTCGFGARRSWRFRISPSSSTNRSCSRCWARSCTSWNSKQGRTSSRRRRWHQLYDSVRGRSARHDHDTRTRGGFQEKLLKRLHKNDTFGETALLNIGGKRSAHIYAEQHSKLLAIDCEPFLKIQTIYNEHRRAEKMDVFNQCLAFRSWKKEELHMLCDKLSIKSYEVGQVVVEQGQKLPELFLLKSGVVKVLKAIPPKLAVDFISKNEELALGHRVKPGTIGGGEEAEGLLGAAADDAMEAPTPSTGMTSAESTPAVSRGASAEARAVSRWARSRLRRSTKRRRPPTSFRSASGPSPAVASCSRARSCRIATSLHRRKWRTN